MLWQAIPFRVIRKRHGTAGMSALLARFKQLLTYVGAAVPRRRLRDVQAAVNYLHVGRFMKDQGFCFDRRVASREAVWDVILERVTVERVLYLEFGVAGGESMRYWSGHLKSPYARLHGFDSFDGMPETDGVWIKGQFSSGGRVPEIVDSRVSFHKGWFDQTLPEFRVPDHDLLILNLDADLYSSTIYVLRQLRQHIRPGSYLYFDEMNHPNHEQRAFQEFMSESMLRFRPIAADRTLAFTAFECIEWL